MHTLMGSSIWTGFMDERRRRVSGRSVDDKVIAEESTALDVLARA